MADFLPYRAEYAKSDRSSCKGCKAKIAKETLRLAAVVQSPAFDGVVPKWYHYICFFAKQKPKAVGDIENFETLKWGDQEKIREKVTSLAGAANGNEGGKKAAKRGAGGAKKGGKAAKGAGKAAGNGIYKCDLAKSNRSTCRGCHETIIKGELRASKVDFESDEGRRYGGVPLWHHLDCFVKLRADLEFWAAADALEGFSDLDKESQEKMSAALPEMKPVVKDEVDGEPAAKKVKGEPMDEEEKKALKKQVERLTKYTSFLKSLKRNEIAEIVEENSEPVQDQSNNIERLVDAMAFGWPLDCNKCKSGKLKYKSLEGAYRCHGNLTEWVDCDNVVREPERRPFIVPEQFKSEFRSIKYKPKTGKRIIKAEERSVVLDPGPSTSSSEPKIKSERVHPLKHMEFVILGKTETPKDELKKEIMKMGGKVVTKIHKKLAAVISTKEEVEKMNKRMQEVEEANIQVVPEVFLQESLAGGAVENITRLNLANWGSDAKKRLEGIESLKSGKSFAKSTFSKSDKSSKVTLKVKNGTAVDPESGLEDTAHVYVKGDDVYTAVLSLTDVARKQNKYYRIQILEEDNKRRYWVFRAWGRIGTTIGGTKLEELSLHEAIKLFKVKFEDETGNCWEERRNFRKVPHRMVPMDLDMGVDEADNIRLNTESDVECKLPRPVQDLVSMLFSVDTMKKVMLEFELDLEKMPLGKISKRQIQSAYTVLSELQRALATEDNKLIVIDATNRFYTLIPHDCGTRQPPLLDNEEIIKSKIEMLESLLEMEIAVSMLKSSDGESGGDNALHPLEAHYHKLNTDIEPLTRDSEEFSLLEKYVKNTHAATHTQYSLVIEEIFKVKRHGEEKRFKPFKKLHNRKLLWHGSRLTNFAGILSQGLRIAPPEAPSTGYMFGKGVYFADMVSKSANYCMTSPSNNTGLLMLCEVALGEMYERTQAEYVQKLPAGKHSCKGVGATCPDPGETHVTQDGVEVPVGKPTTGLQRNQTSLLYNEYIVYDVAQVKAKYLFKMKFDYKF